MSEPERDHASPEPDGARGDITRLLDEAEEGSSEARDQLLHTVYEELRKIANSLMKGERDGHTLGATALVNESYLKLFRESEGAGDFSFSHRHAFYKTAATAMRRILIDHARGRAAAKRSTPTGDRRISADLLEASMNADPERILALDDALARLEDEDERAASVVRLRFYAGRQLEEIAEVLEVSTRTIKRDWEFARARLQELIELDAGRS